MKKCRQLCICLVTVYLLTFALASCGGPNYTLINHYKNDANFIDDTATVTHLVYSEYDGTIVIAFSGLRSSYQDDHFKIPVDVARADLKDDIFEKIKIGDEVKFTSDAWYYGNGYFMPIVAIWSADGEPLLEYKEGYSNLMTWLRSK